MKEKILEVLKGEKLSIEDIRRKIQEKYQIDTTEAIIRTCIWRLKNKEHYPIERCGTINRYKVYELKSNISNENSQLTENLILLMIKAGITSEDYGIEITESEIQSYIDKLMESGKIG